MSAYPVTAEDSPEFRETHEAFAAADDDTWRQVMPGALDLDGEVPA